MNDIKPDKIEKVRIDTILEDPQNIRIHPKENIAQIKASLERFGQQQLILVNDDNIVIAGNGRLVAAKELGWKEIVIGRVSMSREEARAYSIADNKTPESAKWDMTLLASTIQELEKLDPKQDWLALGFSKEEISPLLADVSHLIDVDLGNGGDDKKKEKVKPIKLSAEQREVFERAMDKMKADEQADDLLEGQVVEYLAALYLN